MCLQLAMADRTGLSFLGVGFGCDNGQLCCLSLSFGVVSDAMIRHDNPVHIFSRDAVHLLLKFVR